MTGLSVDTLRAWERRYHVVNPARSGRGRLYGDADVQRFIRLRNVVSRGYSIGEVAPLPDSQLQVLLNLPAELPAREAEEAVATRGIKAIVTAVEAFDTARMNDELGRLAAILSPAEFVYQVALPLMSEVGNRWHAGTLETAHEHLASESIRNLLGAMARLNRAGDTQPRLLATTPAGEHHEVGLLAGAVLAGAHGYQVACLGPDLPADQILFAVERYSPGILLMGMSTPDPSAVTIETVLDVAEGLPANTELWLGGAGAPIALQQIHRPGTVFMDDLKAMERHLTDRRRGYAA